MTMLANLIRFRSMESRLVTLFLAVILIGQAVGFFVIRQSIIDNAQTAVHDQLAIGVPLFQRLLDQKAQKLLISARTVAMDYGFRQAIASNDVETIESVMTNMAGRVEASLTLFVGLNREMKAANTPISHGILEKSILKLIDKADEKDGAVGIGIVDNRLYQMLVVPVRAPITIGWIAMAFPFDVRLASDMRDLSSLDVSFMVRGENADFIAEVSTLSDADAANVAAQLSHLPIISGGYKPLRVYESDYGTEIVPLMQVGEKLSAIVVLQRSIDEAIAPYKKLLVTLVMITGIVTVVAFLLSFFSVRRIASPLRGLTLIAKRLGDGDYDSPIEIKGDDEIRKLTIAFENMRDNISRHSSEIRRLAYWDALTQLPNRAQFTQLVAGAIAHCKEHDTCHVLLMDLDRFKNVNNVMGHTFGDELLRLVGGRLRQVVGKQYDVARLGGDEFAVLLPMTTVTEAKELAAKILNSFLIPILIEDQTIDIGAGIGVAGFPLHGTDAETLISRAEIAMYSAKSSGSEAIFYEQAIDKTSQQNLSLLSEMRRALQRDEFKLFVQPKLLLKTGEFVGFEALVRWRHPEKGMILPDQFIPFAERTGFIRVLTLWMMEQSSALCRDFIAKGIKARISINLSTRDLLDQNLAEKFSEIINRNGVPASSFCLEITESAIMDDPIRGLACLEALHALGVELSVDDFGTGYSSLAYLKRLPVDELKIDKSFVMSMINDEEDVKIVRSTIDLGHNMGLRVVAEGVESEASWHLLVEMGCDQGQGYFMSRPIAANQIFNWIATWVPPRHHEGKIHRQSAF